MRARSSATPPRAGGFPPHAQARRVAIAAPAAPASAPAAGRAAFVHTRSFRVSYTRRKPGNAGPAALGIQCAPEVQIEEHREDAGADRREEVEEGRAQAAQIEA